MTTINFASVKMKPLLTEKASKLTDLLNVYAFIVSKETTKRVIKQVIESAFDVKVLDVNTSIRTIIKKDFKTRKPVKFAKKVAYVKVQSGQKLKIFDI